MFFYSSEEGGLSMIAIVDYGAGNLRSVQLALARLRAHPVVTRDPDLLALAHGIILPGVGAFADAMAALRESGVVPALLAAAAAGKPLLGICLGMQALFDSSEEGEGAAGLGLIPGRVCRLPGCGLKIPHIGWNSLIPAKDDPMLDGLPADPYVYFVHSYACRADNPADVLAAVEYGVPFHAAVRRGNVIGMQFHPEKSGRVGERLLYNFLCLAEGEGR